MSDNEEERGGCRRTVEGCKYADAAADAAVKKVFAIFGVDITRPEQVKDFQESLRFGERLRRIADRSVLAFWCAVAVSLMGAVYAGVRTKFG